MQEFLSTTHSMDEMLEKFSKFIRFDLLDAYTKIRFRDEIVWYR